MTNPFLNLFWSRRILKNSVFSYPDPSWSVNIRYSNTNYITILQIPFKLIFYLTKSLKITRRTNTNSSSSKFSLNTIIKLSMKISIRKSNLNLRIKSINLNLIIAISFHLFSPISSRKFRMFLICKCYLI